MTLYMSELSLIYLFLRSEGLPMPSAVGVRFGPVPGPICGGLLHSEQAVDRYSKFFEVQAPQ